MTGLERVQCGSQLRISSPKTATGRITQAGYTEYSLKGEETQKKRSATDGNLMTPATGVN
jgi:hypothetical protein